MVSNPAQSIVEKTGVFQIELNVLEGRNSYVNVKATGGKEGSFVRKSSIDLKRVDIDRPTEILKLKERRDRRVEKESTFFSKLKCYSQFM